MTMMMKIDTTRVWPLCGGESRCKHEIHRGVVFHWYKIFVTPLVEAAMLPIWQKIAKFIYPTRIWCPRRNFAKTFSGGKCHLIAKRNFISFMFKMLPSLSFRICDLLLQTCRGGEWHNTWHERLHASLLEQVYHKHVTFLQNPSTSPTI